MILYYVALTTEILITDPTNKDSLPNSNVAVVSLHLKEILLVGFILKNPYVWDPQSIILRSGVHTKDSLCGPHQKDSSSVVSWYCNNLVVVLL
jgi:hypothetical protein